MTQFEQRRILEASLDFCDILELKYASIPLNRYSLDLADTVKISRNPDIYAIRLCINAAGRHQDVLLLNTIKNLLRRHP